MDGTLAPLTLYARCFLPNDYRIIDIFEAPSTPIHDIMGLCTKKFLSATPGNILQLLRKTDLSVSDLAGELELTNNAIRSHIASLEKDGFLSPSGKRKGYRKPEVLYTLTPEAELLFPKPYHQVLNVLLDVLKEKLPPDKQKEVLEETGRRIASANMPEPGASGEDRIRFTLNILREMGGLSEITRKEDHLLLHGYSCPLGEVTNHHPEACQLAKILLEELTGLSASTQCRYNGKATCIFRLEKKE